jgi:hypothetical protein
MPLLAAVRPDGFNIGLNEGLVAGQTVIHAHVRVIPRWSGEVPDPRGGIRWVIADKASYWKKSNPRKCWLAIDADNTSASHDSRDKHCDMEWSATILPGKTRGSHWDICPPPLATTRTCSETGAPSQRTATV